MPIEVPLTRSMRFAEFISNLRLKMERGQQVYGDKSFSRDPISLIGEVQEELIDICGWSFVLWCRLRDIQHTIMKLEGGDPVPKQPPPKGGKSMKPSKPKPTSKPSKSRC